MKEDAKRRGHWNGIVRALILLLLLCGMVGWYPGGIVHAAGVSPTAVSVYGQSGNFTTNTANTSGISATSLSDPTGVVYDSSGNLYIADSVNNRVLYYPAGTTTATQVYGQGGSFTTGTANNGGLSATSLSDPLGLALDSSGNLYVADASNSRVLYYPAGTTVATRVYGQKGSFTTATANKGGLSATSLAGPTDVALDSSGNLYVVDASNSRVLYYPAATTTATQVYGQGGIFTTATANKGGLSATSLSDPLGLALDSSGNLYVVDFGNSRVLYYPAGTTTATRVYGQGGSFITGTANISSISATSLAYPLSVAVDSGGNLYVADEYDSRVLYYPAATTTATRVYGQSGSFTTGAQNAGGISANSLFHPYYLAIDSSGKLYVSDYSNNRVLLFQTSLRISTQPPASISAGTPFTVAASLIDVGSGAVFTDFTGSVSVAIKAGTGVAGAVLSGTTPVTAVNGVATFSNLVINKGGSGYILTTSSPGVGSADTNGISPIAVSVYGQSGSFTTKTANTSGISATSLSDPTGIVYDSSGNLYVSDTKNNRVLYYPAGTTTATRVYGQKGSFTSSDYNAGGLSATSLANPEGLAIDSSGNLYVADQYNNRVLYYPAGTTTATRVYGQGGSFTTNNSGTSATSLYNPPDVAVDSSGNVYVADFYNNRVLYYPAGTTTATRVYGQGGSFTSNTQNTGGISADSLSGPTGVAVDSGGNLYVIDSYNNRALYYPAGMTTATRVYGQFGNFTTGSSNAGGISATSLAYPLGIAVDSSGNVYIADESNYRALYYPAGTTTATHVYGQGGSFTSNTAGGLSATSLADPFYLAVDSSGKLSVSDYSNNRVLLFQTSLRISTQPPTSTSVGTPFTVAASLIDVGSGAVFSDFAGSVSVAIKAGTGVAGAVLSGTTPVTAVNGVATFSNLVINKGGSGYILTTSSPGVGSADTNAFTITGFLIFTPLTSPTFAFTLTGAAGTITSQQTFRVNDTTQSGVGWHMMITSTQLTTSAGKTLPTTSLKITAVSTACTPGLSCLVPTNGVSGYPLTVPAATTAPAAVRFLSATGGTGTGDVTLTVTYSLNVPAGSASGTYLSTVTMTLVKGQ